MKTVHSKISIVHLRREKISNIFYFERKTRNSLNNLLWWNKMKLYLFHWKLISPINSPYPNLVQQSISSSNSAHDDWNRYQVTFTFIENPENSLQNFGNDGTWWTYIHSHQKLIAPINLHTKIKWKQSISSF